MHIKSTNHHSYPILWLRRRRGQGGLVTGGRPHCGKVLQAGRSPGCPGFRGRLPNGPHARGRACPVPSPHKHYQALPWETRQSNGATAATPALRPPPSGSEWSLGNHPLSLQGHRPSSSERDSFYKTTQHGRTPSPASRSPVSEGPFLPLGPVLTMGCKTETVDGSRWPTPPQIC